MKYLSLFIRLCTAFAIGAVTSCNEDGESPEQNKQAVILSPSEILTSLQDFDATKHDGLVIEGDRLRVAANSDILGWFSDQKGPLLFEEVAGDFFIETEVEIKRKDGQDKLPEGNYNSAGLIIRDPSSSFGMETWIMYNVGVQNSFYGNEVKATIPLTVPEDNPFYLAGLHSMSSLYLLPQQNQGSLQIRMARVGKEVRCYFKDFSSWVEQKPSDQMEVMGNGLSVPISQFNETEFRPSGLNLPDKVEVGLIANPGIDASIQDLTDPNLLKQDGYALFSYYRRQTISSFSEALED